jgi:hypothetical protein
MWKKMVERLAESNHANGFGMVDNSGMLFLAPPPGFGLENRTSDEEVFRSEGPSIPRKALRGWIWGHRKLVEEGEQAVLWSVFEPDEGQTSVGLSVLIPSEVEVPSG